MNKTNFCQYFVKIYKIMDEENWDIPKLQLKIFEVYQISEKSLQLKDKSDFEQSINNIQTYIAQIPDYLEALGFEIKDICNFLENPIEMSPLKQNYNPVGNCYIKLEKHSTKNQLESVLYNLKNTFYLLYKDSFEDELLKKGNLTKPQIITQRFSFLKILMILIYIISLIVSIKKKNYLLTVSIFIPSVIYYFWNRETPKMKEKPSKNDLRDSFFMIIYLLNHHLKNINEVQNQLKQLNDAVLFNTSKRIYLKDFDVDEFEKKLNLIKDSIH